MQKHKLLRMDTAAANAICKLKKLPSVFLCAHNYRLGNRTTHQLFISLLGVLSLHIQ